MRVVANQMSLLLVSLIDPPGLVYWLTLKGAGQAGLMAAGKWTITLACAKDGKIETHVPHPPVILSFAHKPPL